MKLIYRNLQSILMVLVFSYIAGCGALFTPHLDSGEYLQLIEIAVDTTYGTCETESLQQLRRKTTKLLYHTQFTSHNELMHSGAVQLDQSVQNLYTKSTTTTISPTFCRMSLQIINQMSLNLAKASGGKLE